MNRKIRRAVEDVLSELKRASSKHGPMRSAHEGFGIIYEELDELWDEIKRKDSHRSKKRMRAEAAQVAAMGLRFMADLT